MLIVTFSLLFKVQISYFLDQLAADMAPKQWEIGVGDGEVDGLQFVQEFVE